MADTVSDKEYQLHRTVLVSALPETDHKTAADPSGNPSPLDAFLLSLEGNEKHGLGIRLVCTDSAGVPVDDDLGCTIDFQILRVCPQVNDAGTVSDLLGGGVVASAAPNEDVIEDAIGYGRYWIRIAAVTNTPTGCTEIQAYLREV